MKTIERAARSHLTRTGQPKEVFVTEAAAVAHADFLLGEDLANGHLMTFPRGYECEQGGHWHVGNTH